MNSLSGGDGSSGMAGGSIGRRYDDQGQDDQSQTKENTYKEEFLKQLKLVDPSGGNAHYLGVLGKGIKKSIQ
jgi:hypothetical protein